MNTIQHDGNLHVQDVPKVARHFFHCYLSKCQSAINSIIQYITPQVSQFFLFMLTYFNTVLVNQILLNVYNDRFADSVDNNLRSSLACCLLHPSHPSIPPPLLSHTSSSSPFAFLSPSIGRSLHYFNRLKLFWLKSHTYIQSSLL